MEFITKSAKETSDLGSKIILDLISEKKNEPIILALSGNLGSGKTTFVQGVGYALGIKRIVSPTFLITKHYKISVSGFQKFVHTDAYRLDNFKVDPTIIELRENLSDPKAIVVIEWAEKVKSVIPKHATKIDFYDLEEARRRITIV